MVPDLVSYGVHERSRPAADALELATQFLSGINATVRYEDAGASVKTSFCYLEQSGAVVSNGCGKGIGVQARASALFEAIEHYYSIFSNRYRIDAQRVLALVGDDSFLAGGSPEFERICNGHQLLLSRTLFEGFRSSPVLYPTFLTDPGFLPPEEVEERSLSAFALKRYSTNSGVAAGTSIHEALLHGFLETIERDALGIELLRTVIRKQPAALRRVNIASLEPKLRAICESVAGETSGNLKVWDITTDIGVPVALAGIYVEDPHHFSCFGSGASLSPQYAVERAVLEALQHFHLIKMSHQKPTRACQLSPGEMPRYLQCALSKGIFCYRGGEIAAPTIHSDASQVEQTPEAQIGRILDRLERVNVNAYYRVIVDGPVWVTHVVAPRLERFHLVARGVPVLPGARGRRFLSESTI